MYKKVEDLKPGDKFKFREEHQMVRVVDAGGSPGYVAYHDEENPTHGGQIPKDKEVFVISST